MPKATQSLCPECQDHFGAVQDLLKGSDISFELNHKLVRGLDYYSRTTFEIQTEQLGAQNAVAGGGRYDGLVKLLGGPDHPGTGFAIGAERLVALLGDPERGEMRSPHLFIAALGETAEKRSFNWTMALRRSGLWVEMEYGSKGLKSQMKKADRIGAKKVLIVGDNEIASGKAILRDMKTKVQKDVNLDTLLDNLKKELTTY